MLVQNSVPFNYTEAGPSSPGLPFFSSLSCFDVIHDTQKYKTSFSFSFLAAGYVNMTPRQALSRK